MRSLGKSAGKSERILVVKKAWRSLRIDGASRPADEALRNRIRNSRVFLKQVTFSEDVWITLLRHALKTRFPGTGPRSFFSTQQRRMLHTAGKEGGPDHVDAVAPLVLVHRRRSVVPPEEERPQQHNHENKAQEQQNEKTRVRSQPQNRPQKDSRTHPASDAE